MANLLVVDDDVDIRESLRELLVDEGHQVSCAEDGEAALQMLLVDPLPDLMLLDLIMPGIDGVQVLAQLRQQARFDALRVIVVSASSTVRPPAGVPLVRKPVRLDHLLKCIDEQLHPGVAPGQRWDAMRPRRRP